MRTRGDRADIRQTRVRRGVSRLLFSPLSLALVLVATLSLGVVLAHWSSQIRATVEVSTGTVDLDVTGDLTFDFPGCDPGTESTSCDKFEGSDIGTSPISHSADGATFQIDGWVYKDGNLAEPVGFYYTLTGGTAEIAVKSGRNVDQATLGEGSGYWLNPACVGDPGPGGSVTCTPKNTNSISNIEFCLTVLAPPSCSPLMRPIVASNLGSIPFELAIDLSGPLPSGIDYCGTFDLTVQRVVGGSAVDPPLYIEPLCDLIGSPVVLDEQIDPGDSEEFKLTLSFTEPTSALDGTSGGFIVSFEATQWNEPGGWTDGVDLPLSISIGSSPLAEVSSGALPDAVSARITTQTVPVALNSSVPTVVDVLGRSEVTITSWTVDPSNPAVVLGFDFIVRGDPVYVEVQRGALGWVDERWEEENPHVWHDPYVTGSPDARPITYIEIGLVALPDGPVSEEPAEPVAEESPAEELPAEEPPADEPPAEEPPAETATLVGVVWLDEDRDGVRAATESGAAGVVVRLLSDGVVVATTVTDGEGSYAFSDLDVGEYTFEIEAPSDHAFTSVAQGSDPALDSDVTPVESAGEPNLGRVTALLNSGMTSGVADAGLVQAATEADSP